MLKSSLFVALASILAYSSAQEDFDECDEPDVETSSSAVIATASSSAITGNCPLLPSPTTTDTITTFTAIATVSEVFSVTTTVYATTVTRTAPQPIDQTSISFETATVAATTSTVFIGQTFTSVVFEVVPAETTVIIPRAADFTPLRCESAYVGPFSTVTFPYTTTVSTYSYVSTFTIATPTTAVVFPQTLIFPSVTGNFTETISIQATTTITSTRDDPTSTVYAACQGTDNVTPGAPPSYYYPQLGQPVVANGTYFSVVAAIDQVDCCALCQADERCTASGFYQKPSLGGPLKSLLVRNACQLFLKNATTSDTCDTSYIGAIMRFDALELVDYYSNGPCGQYDFDFGGRSRVIRDQTS